MKKYKYVFLFFTCLSLSLLIAGCECNGIKCPTDKELSANTDTVVPYQKGDVVRFANALGDTIVLSCSDRDVYQILVTVDDRSWSECCSSIHVENLSCGLKDSNDNRIRISIQDIGGYVLLVSGRLSGVDFSDNDFRHKLDSIELNGKVFYDVSTQVKEFESMEFAMFRVSDGKGIVGFTTNGEEWALVE